MTGDQNPNRAPDRRRASGGTARDKAYQRRARRQEREQRQPLQSAPPPRERRIRRDRLTSTGTPIRSAMARVPFVLLVMVLMAGGIVAALTLSTMTDESALQTNRSQQQQVDLRLKIEAAKRDVLSLGSLPRLQQQAVALGLVPAGDAAILVVGPDGKPTVVGTPTPVPGPTPPATTTPVPATTALTTSAPTTSVLTTSVPTQPAQTKTAGSSTAQTKTAQTKTAQTKTARANTAPADSRSVKTSGTTSSSTKTPGTAQTKTGTGPTTAAGTQGTRR